MSDELKTVNVALLPRLTADDLDRIRINWLELNPDNIEALSYYLQSGGEGHGAPPTVREAIDILMKRSE